MARPLSKFSSRHPDLGSRVGRALDNWTVEKGRWNIYLRRDSRFPCTCYDPSTMGAADEFLGEDSCPLCYGTGFKTTPERLRCYLGVPENVSALVTTTSVGDWGRLDQYPGIAYIPRGVFPKKFDLMAECEWSVPTQSVGAYGSPTKLLRLWKITAVLPIIFNTNSESDLFIAGMEHHDLKMELVEPNLITAGPNILPPRREGLLPMQASAESYVPEGGNTGTRYQQMDSPSTSMPAYRGLGRASRKKPTGL